MSKPLTIQYTGKYANYLLRKKEKVINELLKRISDLEFEVERLDSNNQAMQEEMARTWKKLDKAIDYVNKCSILGVNGVDSYCMDYDVKDDLLEILKGDNIND